MPNAQETAEMLDKALIRAIRNETNEHYHLDHSEVHCCAGHWPLLPSTVMNGVLHDGWMRALLRWQPLPPTV